MRQGGAQSGRGVFRVPFVFRFFFVVILLFFCFAVFFFPVFSFAVLGVGFWDVLLFFGGFSLGF